MFKQILCVLKRISVYFFTNNIAFSVFIENSFFFIFSYSGVVLFCHFVVQLVDDAMPRRNCFVYICFKYVRIYYSSCGCAFVVVCGDVVVPRVVSLFSTCGCCWRGWSLCCGSCPIASDDLPCCSLRAPCCYAPGHCDWPLILVCARNSAHCGYGKLRRIRKELYMWAHSDGFIPCQQHELPLVVWESCTMGVLVRCGLANTANLDVKIDLEYSI